MNANAWAQIPEGWPEAPADLVEVAKQSALKALSPDSDRPAHERLAAFYDRSGECAGASFTELGPLDPDDITAVDLHATALLSAEIGPGATRRLLDPSIARNEILASLREIPDRGLLVAGPPVLLAMENFYLKVKGAVSGPTAGSPDDWVAASKLCARKRPNLFPARDEAVCRYLGLLPAGSRDDYRTAWQVFRSLVGYRDVMEAVDALTPLVRQAGEWRKIQTEVSRLRLLDAAISTWVVTYP